MGAGCCGSKNKVVQPVSRPVYRVPDPPVTRVKSAPKAEVDGATARSMKVGMTSFDSSKLIDGYQNEKVTSLEDALQPFHLQIDQLAVKIQEARKKCYFPSKHNLTQDESAALYIYTMKWEHRCVYDHLQAAWNSKDRSQMKPWHKYLKLFKSGLDKLPDAKKEIWQGMPFDERIMETLEKNPTVYTSMGSSLLSNDEIKDFIDRNHGKKALLVGYSGFVGKSAAGYTTSKTNEYFIWPGTKLGVVEYLVADEDGSVILHMLGQKSIPGPETPRKEEKVIRHFKCANVPFSRYSFFTCYSIIVQWNT